MITNQLLYVKFFLRVTRKNPEIGMLYVRISYNTKRVDFSFNHRVDIKSWDSSREKVKSTDKNFREINQAITSAKTRIFSFYEKLRFEEKLITLSILKKHFFGNADEGRTLSFLMEYHFKTQSQTLSSGTLAHYRTTEKYLKEFLLTYRKTEDVYLAQVDYQFVTEFESFLRLYQPTDHHRPMSHNVVMKHITRLRKVINLAMKLDWIQKNPFDRFKVSYKKVDRGYLTNEELREIVGKEFKIKRLRYVRDLFVFACYTGLSYTDVCNLKQENIVLGIDGEKWIYTKRQKTDIALQIPILPTAYEIMERYKEDPRVRVSGTVFPLLSNQKINSYLKEIADLCGINKNITFHLARHTFATTVTLSNGVPIETVSKILGHTKLSTTQIYARVVENKISGDMQLLKEKLITKKTINSERKEFGA
ncbi:site-specific integrase [Labilibacter sediminis]|nr:site-specific integrase [Labilibacter sediminis]